MSSVDRLPSVIIAAASPFGQIHLDRSRDLAIKHSVPTLLCGSSADSSTSALIDSWGNILFRQLGGESWSANVALPYRGGRERPSTTYERLGDVGPLIISAALLIGVIMADYVQWLLGTKYRQKATEHSGLSSVSLERSIRPGRSARETNDSYHSNAEYGSVQLGQSTE